MSVTREAKLNRYIESISLHVCVPVPSPVSILQVAVVAVLVVPVSCVSQGGLEQTLWTRPVAVLV